MLFLLYDFIFTNVYLIVKKNNKNSGNLEN